jgi:dihydropteroate synthase
VISALAMMHGAWGVRVHDVQATVDALKVVEAWEAASQGRRGANGESTSARVGEQPRD